MTGGMQPHMPPQERMRMQKILRDMQADVDDKTHLLDTDGQPFHDQNDDLDKPRNMHEKVIYDKIKRQK